MQFAYKQRPTDRGSTMRTLAILVTLIGLASQPAKAIQPMHDLSIGPPGFTAMDSRCSLSAGGATVDYGVMSRWELQDATGESNALTPGKRTVTVTVVCPYVQPMRLSLRGEAAANGNLRYGDKGHLRLHLREAELDGRSVQVATTTSNGVLNASPTSTLVLAPGQTFAAASGGAVASGRTLTLRLDLEPILPEGEARVSAQRISEAQLTLELVK
jgi:hypothetical protein